MAQTETKRLIKGQERMCSPDRKVHLPQLLTTRTTQDNIDHMDTFWQEAILELHHSNGDLFSDKLHGHQSDLDRNAMTISWLSANNLTSRSPPNRPSLTKSRSLEENEENAGNGLEDQTLDMKPKHWAKSSDALDLRQDEHSKTLNNGRELRSRSLLGQSKTLIDVNQDNSPLIEVNRTKSPPILLPSISTSRQATSMSPLCFEGRLSPNGSSPSLTSSPIASPVSTPRRHRQFQFILNKDVSNSIPSSGLPAGASSLPSSPRVSKKLLTVSTDRMDVRERNGKVKGSDENVTKITGGAKQGIPFVHESDHLLMRSAISSTKNDGRLQRPDTPMTKPSNRIISGLRRNVRLYSSCSDLPKVDEN